MNMHVLTVHEEMKSFICSKCGRGFQKYETRCKHLKICNPRKKPQAPRKPNPCHFCGETFTSFVDRDKHQKEVHLTCPYCKAVFPKMWVFKEHVSATHEKKKPRPCEKCERSFGKRLIL